VNGAAADKLYTLAAEWLVLGPTRDGSGVGESSAADGALDPPQHVLKLDPSEETDATEPGSKPQSLPGVKLEEPMPPAASLEEAAQPSSSPCGAADTVAEAAPSAEDANAAAPEPQQRAAPRTLVFDVCCGTGTIGTLHGPQGNQGECACLGWRARVSKALLASDRAFAGTLSSKLSVAGCRWWVWTSILLPSPMLVPMLLQMGSPTASS